MHIIWGVQKMSHVDPQPTQALDKVDFLNMNPTLNSIRYEFNKNETIQIQYQIGHKPRDTYIFFLKK